MHHLQQVAVFSEPSQVTSVAMSCKNPHTIATTAGRSIDWDDYRTLSTCSVITGWIAGVRLSIFNSVLCEQTAYMTRFKKAVLGVTFRGDGTLIGEDERALTMRRVGFL